MACVISVVRISNYPLRCGWEDCKTSFLQQLEMAQSSSVPNLAAGNVAACCDRVVSTLVTSSGDCVTRCDTLTTLMLSCAHNGLYAESREIWDAIINSSYVPDIDVISGLMNAYGRMGRFGEIKQLVDEVTTRHPDLSSEVFPLAMNCFGNLGQLELMEAVLKVMVSSGLKVDSVAGNAFVKYYSMFGSLRDMEIAYFRLKKSRLLIEKEVIRAMALAYIRRRSFYKLGEFLRDVGLGRRNCGSTLWNLLLLSYAANFRMKSLQREFLNMLESGFSPDLTTFNIRSLAFSRMAMFWDLHLSIEHMKHLGVKPDLVTYGCIVDAYIDRKLGRNLSFALDKVDVHQHSVVLTDPIVFEVFGKGDFHSSSEPLLELRGEKQCTYSMLLRQYLKKTYRANQIFWNY